MGQKTNPISLRLDHNRQADSLWWSSLFYATLLGRDLMVRNYLEKVFDQSSQTSLNRVGYTANSINQKVFVYFLNNQKSLKNSSSTIESKAQILRFLGLVYKLTGLSPKKHPKLYTSLMDSQVSPLQNSISTSFHFPCQLETYRNPSIFWSAHSLGSVVKDQLQRRMSFRNIFRELQREGTELIDKRLIKGFRISLSGRLGGAEIARTEWRQYGQMSLHVFDSHVDFSCIHALTVYGQIGIKVWISYHEEKVR